MSGVKHTLYEVTLTFHKLYLAIAFPCSISASLKKNHKKHALKSTYPLDNKKYQCLFEESPSTPPAAITYQAIYSLEPGMEAFPEDTQTVRIELVVPKGSKAAGHFEVSPTQEIAKPTNGPQRVPLVKCPDKNAKVKYELKVVKLRDLTDEEYMEEVRNHPDMTMNEVDMSMLTSLNMTMNQSSLGGQPDFKKIPKQDLPPQPGKTSSPDQKPPTQTVGEAPGKRQVTRQRGQTGNIKVEGASSQPEPKAPVQTSPQVAPFQPHSSNSYQNAQQVSVESTKTEIVPSLNKGKEDGESSALTGEISRLQQSNTALKNDVSSLKHDLQEILIQREKEKKKYAKIVEERDTEIKKLTAEKNSLSQYKRDVIIKNDEIKTLKLQIEEQQKTGSSKQTAEFERLAGLQAQTAASVEGLQKNLDKMEQQKIELEKENKQKTEEISKLKEQILQLGHQGSAKEQDTFRLLEQKDQECKKQLQEMEAVHEKDLDKYRQAAKEADTLRLKLDAQMKDKDLNEGTLQDRVKALQAERDEANKKIIAVEDENSDLKDKIRSMVECL